MKLRQFSQKNLALRRQVDDHAAVIFGVAPALNQPSLLQPVNQPDHAVVADLQSFCEVNDGRQLGVFRAFHRKQRLMLLGLKPRAQGA